MQSRQHLLGQYNARAVADLDKFQRLVHTDVITLRGGVEELLNPSANPREPDIRNTSAAPNTAWLPTECARPWPADKRKSLLNIFQANPSIRRDVSPRPHTYIRHVKERPRGPAHIGH